MNTKLLPRTCLVLLGMLSTQISAQEYQPIPIQSGYNADVIANGIGTASSSTNNDVDGVNYAFISKDFQLTSSSTPLTYGLPTNGIINSAVGSTSGLSYQLAPYSSNNSLRLQNSGDSGTLTFVTPIKAITLYMLATGGSGACTVDVTANFTDNTSQSFLASDIADWYGGNNFAIQGIGRINLNNNNLESGSGTNPRLYQIPLSIDAANQNKSIQSVTVTKSGTGGIPNIFAFSADSYNPCGSPTNITATTTPTSATLSWIAPSSAPSSGYQYYYNTSSTAPTTTTAPTGSVAAGTTSVTLDNLITGQTYYFWVRSFCGGSSNGFWKMKEFTTGEIPATFTVGDISTDYSDGNPTTTSITGCPGALSINVPAGYKIKSTNVSYTMTAQGGAWMAEQRSLLVCSTNGNTETDIASGSSSSGGTFSYNRTGLSLANGLTGTVNFELRAWRTWGEESLGCDTTYNKVNNGTWTVTVIIEPLNLSTNEIKAEKKEILAYPNPFSDVLYIEKSENVKRATLTDLSGVTVKIIDNPSATLHLDGIKSGVYILTLTTKEGTTKSTKVIKR